MNDVNGSIGTFTNVSSTNLTVTGTININSSNISSINLLTTNTLTTNVLNSNGDIFSNGNVTIYNKNLTMKKIRQYKWFDC